jgi:hypothetical protein
MLFAFTLISSGLIAQRAIWAPGGDENGIGVWEDASNWSTGEIPGTTVDGRAIFKGGEGFVSTDVTGTFRVELGDNKSAARAILTVEDGGILGALRIGSGHSEVGIWAPATLIIEEGGSMSTGSHFWIGSTKHYSIIVDGVESRNPAANRGSEVHINGGTLTVGEMFGIDFYNDKETSGGTLFMNGGLLDLAQWKPVDPTGESITTSLGKHGKIEYTAGLIQIKGNHKESLEYFRDNDQITGDFEIWVEEIITSTDTTYVTKLSKDAPTSDPLTDATLSALTLSNGTLSPDFDAATSDYTAELPAGTTATPTVTATPTNANATVVVTDATDVTSAAEAERTTTIEVTAEDGVTKLTYTVVFSVSTTSVNDLTIGNLIYPNPASSRLYINHDVKIERVEIYNITGSRVLSLNNFTSDVIDISDLNAGLYIISVVDVNNNNIVRRFVKE